MAIFVAKDIAAVSIDATLEESQPTSTKTAAYTSTTINESQTPTARHHWGMVHSGLKRNSH